MDYEQLARMALGFVLEDENWEEFVEWAEGNQNSLEAKLWVASKPNIDRVRRIWLENSGDPVLKELAKYNNKNME
jgi:hypothetical protein